MVFRQEQGGASWCPTNQAGPPGSFSVSHHPNRVALIAGMLQDEFLTSLQNRLRGYIEQNAEQLASGCLFN